MTLSRDGCCADWPKPCSYHEGVRDALNAVVASGGLLAALKILFAERGGT